MALVKLGSKTEGSIVKIEVDGTMWDFIVVHQGLPGPMYDASCDGTWLLMKDCYTQRQWHNKNHLDYSTADVNSYLNNTFINLVDARIRPYIKQVKIPYRNPQESTETFSGPNGMPTRAFLLSATELNYVSNLVAADEGTALAYFKSCATNAADDRRIAYYNGTATDWWTRSPYITYASYDGYSSSTGKFSGIAAGAANKGIRPNLILPEDVWVSDDGTVITNTAPTTPASITIPGQINGGSTVTVEWGSATDAEDNLEGYKVERSLDGGDTWLQIYQSTARSTTNLVPFGSESVMYRVKAYDTEGLESGWKTSAQVTVINNNAPTVPGSITVPEQVQGGQPLAIAWGASSDVDNNLAGYSLERQVNGGDWAVVYSGGELSFTDAITKGWQTVAYRVRAYDVHNAYSGFAVSETREVNNNTPPAITCEYPANSSLGAKNEGFEIPYSITDEEGDEVTVTEAVDGVTVRTFTAELGEENSFQLDGETFMKLLNGTHTITITAADGKSSTIHRLTFAKLVTAASVTLEQPMAADGPITVCVLSVSGSIPLDAEYTVEVTNNALDDEPVWEECTAAVRAGQNHVFENETAANGPAFNFRLHVSRGPSGQGGYITSVQGGFQ